MDRSYWDTASILADAIRLPCHVTRDCPGLAHLQGGTDQASSSSNGAGRKADGSAAGGDHEGMLRKNARVDVPFWLAELLALHGIVDLSVPKPYASRVRNALDAEARSVQLRGLNSWWYAVGIRLGSLMEAGELLDVLQRTYTARIAQIYSSGQHLAASSNMRSKSKSQVDFSSSQINDNVDSLGGYTSITTSAEMVEFINGLEESETSRKLFVIKDKNDFAMLMLP